MPDMPTRQIGARPDDAGSVRHRGAAGLLDDRLLLTVPQAARQLGISRSLMYALMDDGIIASIHVGRLRRIPASVLIDYVSQRLDG